jgi:hypothetical protein
MRNLGGCSLARRALLGLGLAGGLVLASTGLASADDNGTAGVGGTGTLNTPLTFISTTPPCARAGSTFGATATITSATISHGNVSYVGQVTVTWQVDTAATYYEGPEGTYGTSSTCAGTAGTTWGVTATISGTNSAGDTVSCTSLTGDYSRSAFDVIALSDIDGSCTIDPINASPTNFSLVNDEWSATLGECNDSPAPPIPDDCEIFDVELNA